MANKLSTHVDISLSAEIQLNDETASTIKRIIEDGMQRALGEGLLTGYSTAEVDTFNFSVTVN